METFLAVVCFYFLLIPMFVTPLSLVIWLVLLKFTGKSLRNPFSIIDVLTPFACVCVWGQIDAHFAFVHKRMGNLFFELATLGGAWALLFIVRLIVLYFRPNCNKMYVALLTDLSILLLTVIFAFFVPTAME